MGRQEPEQGHLVALDPHPPREDRGGGEGLAIQDLPPERKRSAEDEPGIGVPRAFHELRSEARASPETDQEVASLGERGIRTEDEEHVSVEPHAPSRCRVAVLARGVDLLPEALRPLDGSEPRAQAIPRLPLSRRRGRIPGSGAPAGWTAPPP